MEAINLLRIRRHKARGKHLAHVGQNLKTLLTVTVKQYLELLVAVTVIHVCITKNKRAKISQILVQKIQMIIRKTVEKVIFITLTNTLQSAGA